MDINDLLVCAELTMTNLTAEGSINDKDFLDRVDILCSLGYTVMLSNYDKYYKLIPTLSNMVRKKKIGIVLGIPNLVSVFDERYYEDLSGGILECFGVLFGNNVKMLVYPSFNDYENTVYRCDDFARDLKDNLRTLFMYVYRNRKIEDLNGANKSLLYISSDEVLDMIRQGTTAWETMVPSQVTETIKTKKLLGYKAAASEVIEVTAEVGAE